MRDLPAILGHLVVDLVLLAALLFGSYRRRRRDSEMMLALAAFNVGLFATLVAIAGDHFSAGAGFGLFGLLSLIRLRSASFTTSDMAYAFVSLVLGLVLGLPGLPIAVAGTVALALVLLLVVGDHPRLHSESQLVTLVLDRAHAGPHDALRDVQARLAVTVVDVTITEVDYVRETTTVVATCIPVREPVFDARPAESR